MAYETKPNSGSLFKNDKQDKQGSPQATGKCLIGGVEYRIAAWTNTTQSGVRYQSLKFTPVAEQEAEQRQAPRTRDREVPNPISDKKEFEDDQIPF